MGDDNPTLYAVYTPITYYIRYNSNGGTGYMSQAVLTYDKEYKLSKNNFKRDGYTFVGWATSATPTENDTIYADEAIVKNLATSSYAYVNFYAQWAKSCNVTFDKNGGDGTMETQAMLEGVATALNENTFTRTGYTFAGWTTAPDGSGTVYADKSNITVNNDTTLYAKWKANDYTITFDPTDGALGDNVSNTKSVTYDQAYGTLPTPTLTGYTFTGWYTSADDDATMVTEQTIYNIAENQTLIAKWTPNTYHVVFNNNGGAGTMENQSFTYDDNATRLTKNTYTKQNYIFTGWNTQADGNGISYKDKAEVKNLTATPNGTVTLFAQWLEAYSVTYDKNGDDASGDVNMQIVYAGESVTLSANAFTRPGYTFIGWNTQADGNGTNYSTGTEISNVTANIALFAKWKANNYTITFDPTDGALDENVSNTKSVTYDQAYGTLPTPTLTGYTFTGWYTSAADDATMVTEQTTYKITDNQTLIAKWAPNSYKVVFNGNGGAGTMDNQSFTYDGNATRLTTNAFSKENHVFTGWNTKADGSGTSYGDNAEIKNITTVANDTITLYAQWAEAYCVTYSVNSNDVTGNMEAQIVYLGDDVILSNNSFARAGYTFVCWNTQADGNGTDYAVGSTIANVTTNITLYPKWKANKYTIVFDMGCDDATGTMENMSFTYDIAQNLASNSYSRTGYAFDGWKDNDNNSYSDEQSAKNLTTEDGALVTLSAKWVPNTYNVKFDKNDAGATGNMADQTFTYGAFTPLKGNTFANGVYDFVGWNTKADGTGDSYTNGQIVHNLTATNEETITLYARWGKRFTITFDGNGADEGSTMAQQAVFLGMNMALNTNTFTKSGYTFAGWNTQADGNGTFYADGSIFNATEDTTLYATWRQQQSGSSGGSRGYSVTNTYTITFETNGGSKIQSTNVEKNKTVTEPSAPTKDGYTFDGWYTDKELTSAYNFNTKVTKAFTLYAKWAKTGTEPIEPTTPPDATGWVNPFADVKPNDWYYGSVKYAVENNLMNGTTISTFSPNELITRAMLVTILYRNEGEPEVAFDVTFKDIDANAYYAKAVVWGQQNGIINGYSETEFAPGQNITREQIATIIHRYMIYKGYDTTVNEGASSTDYTDYADVSGYAKDAVSYAISSGLLNGKTETTLNPLDNATRAEIATILQRFIEANK